MRRMRFAVVFFISLLLALSFLNDHDANIGMDRKTAGSTASSTTDFRNSTYQDVPRHMNWRQELGGDVALIFHGDDGRTYYTSEDGYLRCMDNNGDEVWRILIEYSYDQISPHICRNGTSFFVLNGYLTKISREGEIMWKLDVYSWSEPVFSTADGTFLVKERDRSIHKVSMEGETVWTYQLDHEIVYDFHHYSNSPRVDYDDYRIMETYVTENGEVFFTTTQWRDGYENSTVVRLSPDGEKLSEYLLETEAYPRFQPLTDGSILEIAGYLDSNGSRIFRHFPDRSPRELFSSTGFIELEQYGPDGSSYIVTERIDHVRRWFHILSVEEERVMDSYEPGGIISIINIDIEDGAVIMFFVNDDDDIFIRKVGNDLVLLYEFPIEEDDPYYLRYIPDDRFLTLRNESILCCLASSGEVIFEYDLELSVSEYFYGYYYQMLLPTHDSDGNIVTFDRDGLVCLDDEGKVLWRDQPGGTIYSDPVIDHLGRMVIANQNGRVTCISKQGEIVWDHHTASMVYSTPVITDDGSVLVADNSGEICSLSPEGALQWNISLHEPIYEDLGVSSGGDIIAASDNAVYSILPDGKVKWTHETSGDIRSTPMMDIPGNIVLATSENLSCLSENGTLLWHVPSEEMDLMSSPVLGPDGSIYVGGRDINIFDMDGNPLRNIKIECRHGDIEHLAFTEDGRILAVEDYGDLTSYWPNGTISWTIDTESISAAMPLIDSSGNIIFKSFSLYCISPEGEILWRYVPSHSRASTSLTGSSPVLLDDGNIVFCHSSVISLNLTGGPDSFEPPKIRDLEFDDNSMDILWEIETPQDGTMVDGYRVYHSDDGTVPDLILEISHLWGVMDGSRELPTGYFYVSSFNSNGESDLAGPLLIDSWERPWIPDPPENITIDEGYDYIEIYWDPPADDGGSPITNYLIFRSKDRENYTLIAKPGPDAGSYRDSGLDTNRWYYYKIGVENEEGYRFNQTVLPEYTYYDGPLDSVPLRIFTVCGLPILLFAAIIFIFYLYLKKTRRTGPVWHDGGPVDFSTGGGKSSG